MTRRRRRGSGRRLRLRDRFLQASVARALTSPMGLVVGSTASATLLGAGAHPAIAVLAGAAAWALPVARAMARVPGLSRETGRVPRTNKARTGASEAGASWDAAVSDAEAAADKFQRSIDDCRDGPLRDRLVELEEDVLQSLEKCRELAEWGAEVEAARREVKPEEMKKIAERAGVVAEDAARSQRQLVADLASVEDEARVQLALINGRLDEAVGRAVEIVGRARGLLRSDPADPEDTDVAASLAALSAALHEVDRHDHPHRLPAPQAPKRRAATRNEPHPGTTATG